MKESKIEWTDHTFNLVDRLHKGIYIAIIWLSVTAASLAQDKVRFYPRENLNWRMAGGVFEGASIEAGPYTALFALPNEGPGSWPANNQWTEMPVSFGAYRFLRYRGPAGSFCNVAEVEFWRDGKKIAGIGYGTPGSWSNNGNTFHKAIDGNTATQFDAPTSTGAEFVGIDRGVVMVDSPFGVMTHFAQFDNPDVMPLIAAAGITNLRDEHYWNAIENPRGVYTYPASYGAFMSAAASNGITPLMVLTWSNNNYDVSAGQFTLPHTGSGRKGFASYALNLINHYSGQVKALEVWNEVNAGTFIAGPATVDKPVYYYILLRDVYETIKATHPEVKIIAGATVPVAHGFFKSLFTHGAMPYLDAVSVHPYVSPEVAALDISALRDLIKEFNGGVEKPVWATEFSMNVPTAADRDAAAIYTAQIAIVMLSERVEKMFYYLMVDGGSFPYRGLVGSASDPRGKYAENPAYHSYSTVAKQLTGSTFISRWPLRPSTYAFRFSGDVTAIWAFEPMTVNINTTSPLTVTDMMGQITTKTPVAGVVVLPVTRNPQYVRGPITGITEAANSLVAECTTGYWKTQGQNGWSYGYIVPPYNAANFVPMTWGIYGGDNYRWLGASQYHFITESMVHPDSRLAVRRWTSPISGTVRFSGNLSRSWGGDGVTCRIFVDGVQKFSRLLNPSEAITFDVPGIVVSVGSKVDFCVDQNAENSFDATTFTVAIRDR